MCNRPRMLGEAETIIERFRATGWLSPKPRDNRFDPVELHPSRPGNLSRA
jgi:hypothetical protein